MSEGEDGLVTFNSMSNLTAATKQHSDHYSEIISYVTLLASLCMLATTVSKVAGICIFNQFLDDVICCKK